MAENNAAADADLRDPRVRAFLDTISSTEGTLDLGWNAWHNGKKLPDLNDFPYAGGVAAGRYQLLGNTFDEVGKARLGLKDFSDKSQDKTAAFIMRQKNIVDALRRGDMADAIKGASEVWASIPISAQKNHSAMTYKKNGKDIIDPKTGAPKRQPSVDYKEVIGRYKFFLECYLPNRGPLLRRATGSSPQRSAGE